MTLKLLFPLILPMAFFGCEAQNPAPTMPEKTFVYDLNLVSAGRDYPYDKQGLEGCIERDDYLCLSTFNSVVEARDVVLSQPKPDIFKSLFAIIDEHCRLDNQATNQNCAGANIAFYFLDSQDDDDAIKDGYAALSPETRFAALDQARTAQPQWMENRKHDIPAWQAWVKSLDLREATPESDKRTPLEDSLIDRLLTTPGDSEAEHEILFLPPVDMSDVKPN